MILTCGPKVQSEGLGPTSKHEGEPVVTVQTEESVAHLQRVEIT